MKPSKDALLLVDLQNDFFPGGALPVANAHEVLEAVNALLEHPFAEKIATQDWHPKHHESFAAEHSGKKPGDAIKLHGITQILWPVHCVQNTQGSAFAPGWDFSKCQHIVHKGLDPTVDSYSAFFDNERKKETGLHAYLQKKGITRLYIAGLATDYCVKYTVLDALELGYEVFVIQEGVKGVELNSGDSEKALNIMRESGAKVISAKMLK